MKDVNDIVSKLTLEEKASLCTGVDSWHTQAIDRLGIKSVKVSDGPHGLRTIPNDSTTTEKDAAMKATCFPAGVTTACSFDVDLLYEEGKALAKEAINNGVNIILGPAINIKRGPLCGRNFEYFSEDPYLAGKMGASLVKGIQSENVGACIKHYLANNQEYMRLVSNSVVDERAIREIYAKPFEIAIKDASPATIMCSYNLINGVYASDNKYYMNDVAREEWGFKGLIMTDWGAMNDKVASVNASVDLEMPCPGKEATKKVLKGVEDKKIDEKVLDTCSKRVIELQKYINPIKKADFPANHELSRKIARESAVLLKNDNNVLPFKKDEKIIIIGELFEKARYQGVGSSVINTMNLNNAIDEFNRKNVNYEYKKGYLLKEDSLKDELIKEAIDACSNGDKVLIFAGLPEDRESEGFDRPNMDLPSNQNHLIDEITKVNNNVTVILEEGSPVALPWVDKVEGLLLMNLTGENNGGAIYDLVFGDYSPSGRLAETYPISIEDTPCYHTFANSRIVPYLESIFVGYRFYDKANIDVNFPFGYGLSYSKFTYSDMSINKVKLNKDEKLSLSFKVKNVGNFEAKEVIQVYVEQTSDKIYHPLRELKRFKKINLKPNESIDVTIELDYMDFAFYNTLAKKESVIGGSYYVLLGKSSREVIDKLEVVLEDSNDEIPDYSISENSYFNFSDNNFKVDDFVSLLGKDIQKEDDVRPFTISSTFRQMNDDFICRMIYNKMLKIALARAKDEGERNMVRSSIIDLPLRSLIGLSEGAFTFKMAEGIVMIANGKRLKGLAHIIKKNKE